MRASDIVFGLFLGALAILLIYTMIGLMLHLRNDARCTEIARHRGIVVIESTVDMGYGAGCLFLLPNGRVEAEGATGEP